LKRGRGKQQREIEEAKGKEQDGAEAKRLADEKKFQELADKHRAEADKAVAERDALQATLREYQLRGACRAEAERQKLQFGNQQAADDALKLADLTGIDIDDSGVRNMDRVLKQLHEDRPYLFQQLRPGADTNAPQGRGGTPAQQNDKEREQALRQRFRI
jgi:hypothetical protein